MDTHIRIHVRRVCLASAVLGCSVLGCAGFYRQEVPGIEPYLPKPPVRSDTLLEKGSTPDQGKIMPESAPRGQPLTLEACVSIALDNNPMQRAAREGVAAAKEEAGGARAPYFPEFGINAGYGRWQRHIYLPSGLVPPGTELPDLVGPTDDWTAGMRARYTLFDGGERRAQLRAALAREGMAEEDAAGVRQEIALIVHKAFYGLIAAKEALLVAEKNLERDEVHLRLAKERYAIGIVPKADVLRTQVEFADARLAKVRAESLVRVAQGNLNTSMGLPVELPVEIGARPQEITSVDDIRISEALDQAVHARPELKASLQRIAAARHVVDEAKSTFWPKVKTEAGYGWRDADFWPGDEEWLLGVSIDVPVFAGLSRIHRLAAAKTLLSREEAEIEQRILCVREEVWTAYSSLKESYEAVQAAKALTKDAEESHRLANARYEVEAGTVNDLLDAQTALARAEAAYVEAQWDYHIAQAVYRRAVGNLTIEQ